jgi:ATP-dependent Clp protease adaptor protein ClpS
MGQNNQLQDITQKDTLQELTEPPLYKVLLLNDHYTTMDFVVQILMEIFHKPLEEATRIMLEVHHKGKGVCGIYPKEIAETKVYEVHERAQANGFPLRASLEKE